MTQAGREDTMNVLSNIGYCARCPAGMKSHGSQDCLSTFYEFIRFHIYGKILYLAPFSRSVSTTHPKEVSSLVDDPMEETKTNKKILFSLQMKMETGTVESVQRELERLTRAGFPQTVTGITQSQDLKSRVADIL